MLRVTPEEFQRISAVFQEALQRESSDRPSYLAQACGGDAWLQSKVEYFLGLHSESYPFLQEPLVEMLGLACSLDSSQTSFACGALLLDRLEIVEPLEDARQSSIYLARDTRL